jgi:leucyl aminopeptidase
MFGFTFTKRLILLLIALRFILCSPFLDTQVVLRPSTEAELIANNDAISTALKKYPDPVAALVSLQPNSAVELGQPRLLQVFGEQKPQWMTEGDKLRLRSRRRKFMDMTDNQRFYEQQIDASWVGKARKFESAKSS